MPLPTDPFVKTQVFKSWFKNLDSGLENGKMVKSHFFFAGNVLLKNFLFIWLHHVLVVACGIYFPNQGLNPGPQGSPQNHNFICKRTGRLSLSEKLTGVGDSGWCFFSVHNALYIFLIVLQ